LKEFRILWIYPTTIDIFLHNTAIINCLDSLAQLHNNVYLISARSKQRLSPQNVATTLIPLRFIPLLSPAMFTVALFFYLPVKLLSAKPDVVVFAPDYCIIDSIPVLSICKLKRIKCVLDIRSVPVETKGFRGQSEKYWFIFSISLAKKFFKGFTIITPQMRKQICDSYKIDNSIVGTWSSGVSEVNFDPHKYDNTGKVLKDKMGLDDKFVVFYHGVFTASRGLKETVEAIKILHKTYPDIVLFMLGSGPISDSLKELTIKYNLERNVLIHDPVKQSDVPTFIAISDLPIIPLPNNSYWRYQSPLKLLEYLSMGKTVVLTDLPAHKSIIGKARCGVYFSSTDPEVIARAIEFAYLNRKSLGKWGEVGRKIILERFTWKRVAGDLSSYLWEVAKHK
jgi:glycosyltransferase involved in cell wall biosynthesis